MIKLKTIGQCAFVIAILSVQSCVADNANEAPFEIPDFSRPGVPQERLDKYSENAAVYTSTMIDVVIEPEYLLAYQVAIKTLEELRAEYGRYGQPSDYLTGFGGDDETIVITFMARLRQQPKDVVQEALDSGSSSFSLFYTYGDAVPLSITMSRSNYDVLEMKELVY